MKTENKIFVAQVLRDICLAGILFAIPLFISTSMYNSFRLPKNTLFICLTLGALFFSLMYFLEKKSIDWKRYKFVLILSGIFLLLKILVWAFSANPDISFWGSYGRAEGLFLWIAIIVFFILLLFNDWTTNRKRIYAFVIVLSTIGLCGYGVLQKYDLIPNIWSSDVSTRIISTMGNPLNLSAYLILTIPFFYYCVLHFKNIFIRIITISGLGLSIITLYFTESRSSWIAFLFANFVLFTFYFYRKNKKIFVALILLGVIATSTFTYLGITQYDKFEQPALKRLFSVFNIQDLSNRQRLLYWSGSWDAFKERPIFGWGHDFLGYAFDKNYPPKLSDLPETHIDRAHNWHFDVLVMEGIFVWVFEIFILLFGFWKAIKLLKADKKNASLGLLYIYLFAACLLQFLFMFALISPRVIIVFALALIFSQSYSQSEYPTSLSSRLLNKAKTNSNLYLVLGIGLSVFIFFIVLKPTIANIEITNALMTQKNVLAHMQKAENIMSSEFYRQQLGSLYLKYANEGRVMNNELKRTENGKKASAIFEPLVEDYPYNYSNYEFLAESYDLQRNYELVDSTLQKTVENFPTRQDIYWKWAGFLKIRNENERAIEKCKLAIDIDPDVAYAYYKMGQLYQELGDKEKANEYKTIAFEKGLINNFIKLSDRKLYNQFLSAEQTP